ncbi:MAG: GNAT family N-acetyltransferase [Candidatus Kryptonium sp.]
MKIRQAKSVDIDDITNIISTSFLISDYQGLRESIIDNPRYSYKDIIVVEDGNEIIACMKIIPLKASFKGKIINLGGISAVAVLPEYRKRGIADMMLKDALKRMYEANYPFSILYPFQHRFYRKYGWEYIGSVMLYEVEPSNIVLFDERLKVRKMKISEREKIKKVYAEKIKSINFALLRNDAFWTRIVFPNFPNPYVYDNREIEGYVSFEMKKNENSQIEIYIKELIALTPESYRGLWGFLASLSEQVSKIKYLAPLDEPFYDVLIEPREKDYKRPFFEYKSYASICSGFMARIINLTEALKLITTANAPNGEVTIEISDSFLPDNNLTFKIFVEDFNIFFEKTHQSADIKSDIGSFTQIISGFSKPSSLYRIGRINGNEKALKFLDSIFADSLPFMFQFDIF